MVILEKPCICSGVSVFTLKSSTSLARSLTLLKSLRVLDFWLVFGPQDIKAAGALLIWDSEQSLKHSFVGRK